MSQPLPPLLTTSSPSQRALQGTGRTWSIQARPPQHVRDHTQGTVHALVPPWRWVNGVRTGKLTLEQYRIDYLTMLSRRLDDLWPGRLLAETSRGLVPVEDGDTLWCTCGYSKTCHRSWAGVFLVRHAGWRVQRLLPVASTTKRGLPCTVAGLVDVPPLCTGWPPQPPGTPSPPPIWLARERFAYEPRAAETDDLPPIRA